jgi:hypothetical protein
MTTNIERVTKSADCPRLQRADVFVFVRGTCVAAACFTGFNLLEKHSIDAIGYKQINRRTGKIGIERRAAR